ncbi:MFS transporter [Flavobacterium capsici]|uniref:MFS transporter n=1 Tax=Flavobacterium capsici TaxID=3075618 RepID=A0AA96J1R9_9FLAO|nr:MULTISPECIES: MFS transporter [unclassified Flavobacterium]WNM18672.1 MFS transporter [Flavobacterium sp. PMR2A8]WNM22723.1 MFS transporter [Flavobacterium sp. PMTSA4]
MSTTNLPSLSENTFLRYFNFIALYFAQGVPEGMLLFGIPAWMAMNGKSAGEIASFAIACGLPWSFKFIVAPMMDRYTILSMGRKRPWVIFGQLGLMTSFILMSFIPDPLNNLNLLMLFGFIVSFFGAFQDVATDGMAVDIIPIEEQARANGFMWGSKIVGTSSSLALGSWLLNTYSFAISIAMLSILVGFIMLVPIFLKERPGEKTLPWTKGQASPENKKLQVTNWKTIFKSLFSVFSLKNSLLIAIIGFIVCGCQNYMDILLPLFTVKNLGWTDLAYSQVFATSSLIGGISGMLIGGILIDKFGKKRMLNTYLLVLITSTLLIAFLKNFWVNTLLINSYMFIYSLLMVFCNIGFFAICMECCWKKISASQFTLYMTISNIGRIAFAALISPIRTNFSWEISIISFSIFIFISWVLLQFLNINHQVKSIEHLEKKDIESQGMLVTLTQV